MSLHFSSIVLKVSEKKLYNTKITLISFRRLNAITLIKEVIDQKKIVVFLVWCRLTAVLPSAHVRVAHTRIFDRCGF